MNKDVQNVIELLKRVNDLDTECDDEHEGLSKIMDLIVDIQTAIEKL